MLASSVFAQGGASTYASCSVAFAFSSANNAECSGVFQNVFSPTGQLVCSVEWRLRAVSNNLTCEGITGVSEGYEPSCVDGWNTAANGSGTVQCQSGVIGNTGVVVSGGDLPVDGSVTGTVELVIPDRFFTNEQVGAISTSAVLFWFVCFKVRAMVAGVMNLGTRD